MKTFITIWFGQTVSQIGTAMTRFALLIWAYQQTGSATSVALLGFAAFLPMLLVSPFAGVWVDRLDRRKLMLAADMGAGVITAVLLLLFVTGNLALWHIYLAEALAGVFEAFQYPAYLALSSTLLPKEQYGRASGLRSLSTFGAQVLAPVLGGLLLGRQGISSVMMVDLITFLAAFVTLMVVQVPLAGMSEKTKGDAKSFRQEMGLGFGIIKQHPGLIGLVAVSVAISFFAYLTWMAILPAMILARSQNSELALASVQGAMGIAGVIGGVCVSLWGGPRRKVRAYLGGVAISFLLGDIPLAIGRSLPFWVIAGGVGSFFIPFLSSAYDAIWQSKISPALQGRVFAARDMIARAPTPFAYLLAGVLADRLLEPAMMADGSLTPIFGWLVGSGPGAGMALMFIGSAVSAIVICLTAYLFTAVRHVEDNIPDHDRLPAPTKPNPLPLTENALA